MIKAAKRVLSIEESKSVGLATVVNELRAAGQEIIGFNVGETDITTPEVILDATKKALYDNETRYSWVPGLPRLRQLIAKKMNESHQLKVDETNILVSNGSKQILYNIFQTICNPGDEVLIIKPFWVTFPESIKLAEAIPIFVNSINLLPDFEDLEKKVSKKSKAIVINTPNNPTGVVYPKEILEKIANFAEKHNLTIVSDEAYEAIVYEGHQHISIASLSEETFNRTLTVQSFSKTYCMTGFRVGYIVGPQTIIRDMIKFQGHLCGNICTFAQHGAIAALEHSDEILKVIKTKMRERSNLAFDLSKDIFSSSRAQGAFYLFPEISHCYNDVIKSDEDLAISILEKAHVAVLPGSAFGHPNHLRISFANNLSTLKKGFQKIKEIL